MDPEESQPNEYRIIKWSAPTHVHTHRSNDWYWALGILALFGSIASVLWGNVLFAGIIVIGAISVLIIAARQPRHCDVSLHEDGVVIDQEFYPYDSIHSFWVAEDLESAPKLFFTTTGIIHPHISIPLVAPADPEEIRRHLAQFLPEEGGHSLGTWFAEFLGF